MKDIVKILIGIIGSVFLFGSCELDDYTEPESEISGQVIDAITGKPLQSQQPEGYQIRLLEEGYTEPNLFWGMENGNFKNVRLFPVTYSVKPTNGPFVDPQEQTVKLPATGLTFTVQPYVNISGTASLTGNTFNYSCNLKKGAGGKVQEIMFIICENNPHVSAATYTYRQIMQVTGVPDELIFSSTYSGNIDPKNFEGKAGKTYYVRFAAKTSSAGRYNYSEPIKIN